MRRTLQIPTAEVFLPLLEPSRYKGAFGGRGSGKSVVFADMLIEQSLAEPGESGEGLRSVCIREVQKDLAQSSKLLIESKIKDFQLTEADGFKIFRDVITTPRDGLIIFKGMNDYTADSIKSLEGFKRAWWEESQTATAHSLNLLRPTIRAKDSELWFSWNPRRKTDPVDVMLRGPQLPTGAVVVRANWRDNPWFPKELEQERLDCMRTQPDQYDHIWEGGYVSVIDGAYYAKCLTQAKTEGRITRIAFDPLMKIRLFCDIGGTGARADAFTMWPTQFVGREIRTRDYYESVGQPLATHINWLRSKGYTPDRAEFWLPHDGATQDRVYSVSYESALREAGYDVTVVPNQGKGAASLRIEAGRRRFPLIWFDEESTSGGRDALGWYHEKKDDNRNIGLGPEHDWACLPAGTLIKTPDGYKAIEKFIPGDKVSICGLNPKILVAKKVGKQKIIQLNLPNRVNVRCSEKHKFFTADGLIEAYKIKPGTILLTENEVSQWSGSKRGILGAFTECFQELNTVFGRNADCTPAKSGANKSFCTENYGSHKTVQFQKRTLLSRLMAIGTTSHWTIGFAALMRKMANILKQNIPHKNLTVLLLGKYPKQDITGQSPQVPQPICTGLYGSFTRELFRKGLLSTILTTINPIIPSIIYDYLHRRNILCTTGVTVLSVAEYPAEDVYDIEVDHHHAYVLHTSKVVTSNSHGADSFGLMCVAYEIPDERGYDDDHEEERAVKSRRGGY